MSVHVRKPIRMAHADVARWHCHSPARAAAAARITDRAEMIGVHERGR